MAVNPSRDSLITLKVEGKDMIRLRNDLTKIITGVKKGNKKMGNAFAKKLSKSMTRELNRQGFNWFGKLARSVQNPKRSFKDRKVKFTWDIPLYGVWLNKTRRGTYWAPTFVRGNKVKGQYKDNIRYLEMRRNSWGMTKKQMPFIRIKPSYWMVIAFKNMDRELDAYLNGKTDVDKEILKAIGR